ncbi:MAG: tRNA epoxyqueuosine(34) reductase QueG [Rhodospirillales bacterium]
MDQHRDLNPKDVIRSEATRLGFGLCGFARADDDPNRTRALRAFLKDGRHGDMDWMASTADRRSQPRHLWPAVQSVVALGFSYAPATDPRTKQAHRDRAAISCYAQGADYHDLVKKRVKALARFIHDRFKAEVKVFVDTAPVMEKPLARAAGIGWQGKHTNLVSRAMGNWFFLAEVFTTLDIPADRPEPDHCGRCDACRQACPTNALDEPYRMDARACLSYLTIEHKGAIPPHLMAALGNRVYGCDDCLAACPWNKFSEPTTEAAFLPRGQTALPRLADLADLDDAAFRQVFAGSPIKRTGRDRFLRNLAAAVGNSDDPALLETARKLAADASPLVADAGRWAVARLDPPGGIGRPGSARPSGLD